MAKGRGRRAAEIDVQAEVGPRRPPCWRFVPLGVVVAGLAFGYAMGWHQYLTLGYLGNSQDS